LSAAKTDEMGKQFPLRLPLQCRHWTRGSHAACKWHCGCMEVHKQVERSPAALTVLSLEESYECNLTY